MKIESRIDGLVNIMHLANIELKKIQKEVKNKLIHVHYNTSFKVVDYYGTIEKMYECDGNLYFQVKVPYGGIPSTLDRTMFTFVEESDEN